jgi:transposase
LIEKYYRLFRKTEFDLVVRGEQTLGQAAERLGLSYRQCRRSFKRFKEEGDAGLVHRSRGRPSNRRRSDKLRARVVKRYGERYAELGFGPTLAAEKLAEEGLVVDHETLRRWLLEEGLWKRRRKSRQHRERRERKEHFGELVQMDGSHHRWFGPERPSGCLMNMVDDARGITLSTMYEEETTQGAMELLWRWVETYGIPRALYTDRKTVFVTDREATVEEQLAGEEPKTAFGKACERLGIEIITAYSPQAKGRVERNHGVYQDRLVKELGLRRITTIATTNKLLHNGFTAHLNKRFECEAKSGTDYHRPVPRGLNLADVFCREEHRVVQNDWTVRFNNRHYQILNENRPSPKPKDKVVVRVRLDGSLHLIHKGSPLTYRLLSWAELTVRAAPKPPAVAKPKPKTGKPAPPRKSRTPWRQNCTVMFADTKKKTKKK